MLRFDEIKYNQLLCASTGNGFIKQAEINKEVEMKANWYRTRKSGGENATSLRVISDQNPIINVSITDRTRKFNQKPKYFCR
jgi:hypothetical protein